MKDYTVVIERDLEELRRQVDSLMAKGFKLVGGISVSVANGAEQYLIYAQALALA